MLINYCEKWIINYLIKFSVSTFLKFSTFILFLSPLHSTSTKHTFVHHYMLQCCGVCSCNSCNVCMPFVAHIENIYLPIAMHVHKYLILFSFLENCTFLHHKHNLKFAVEQFWGICFVIRFMVFPGSFRMICMWEKSEISSRSVEGSAEMKY